MYKLTYKGQFVDGFDEEQVIGNLAQLLNLKPKAVRLAFLSDRSSVIKVLDSASEVERWCAAFQEAGVYLDVAGLDAADVENIAGQIELELELHELDLDEDEPDERHYLIRKVHNLEPASEPQTFANQPLATRPLAAYPTNGETPAAKVAAPLQPLAGTKPVNGHAINNQHQVASHRPVNGNLVNEQVLNGHAANGHVTSDQTAKPANGVAANGKKAANGEKSLNGERLNDKPSANGSTNGSTPHKNGNTNGSHQSVIAAPNPIEIGKSAAKPKQTKKPATARPVAQEINETAVHELSVAQIDALTAQQLLEESVDTEEAATPVLPVETKAPQVVAKQADAKSPVKPQVETKKAEVKAKIDAAKTAPVTPNATAQSQPLQQAQTQQSKPVKPAPPPVAAPVDDEPQVARQRGYSPDEDIREMPDELIREEEQALHDAGLAEEMEEELHEDVNFHKSHFVWGMLVILLAIIATAGTILWLKRSTWAPVTVSPHELKITDAIASSSMYGLLHADISRLQLLSPSTNIFANFAEPQPGFWDGLASAGIDVSAQVDDVWLGAYGQSGQSKALWVLHGNFPVDTWNAWLKKSYIIDSDSPDGIIFSTLDENSCEKSPVMSATITNNQIVLGAPELVAAFNGRLQAGAAAEKNLETWAKGYNTQMISAVLFQPGQLPEGAAAMALGKISLPAEPIQGIYLGLEPKKFPPVVEFSAVIASNDQHFITDASNKLKAAAAVAKTTIANDWPETLQFYEDMKFAADTNQLRATLNMDEQAPQHIQVWVASLLSRAFGVNNPAPVVASEERLEAAPGQFVNLTSADLPAFANVKHFNEAFIAQTSSGPFGIGIRTVEETDQGVEINLDVNAFNLPNLGKESDGVSMRITDIVDHQDKSVLAATTGGCGGMAQPTNINLVYQGNALDNGEMVSFTGLQGAKKILLPAGISLAGVGAVKGVIHHQLPVTVEHINVNGPLAGKTVELNGMQLRFLSADPNRLYFQLSGNTSALLQVNALNEDGKALASTNTIRNDNVFGGGRVVSIDYQGQIAAAEIVVASKLEKKDYEFSIARLFPPARPFMTEKSEPTHLVAASLPALEKDSPPHDVVYPYQTPKQTIAAGPALIALNDLSISGQQFSLLADVYTRSNHPLVGQLSAVRLVISEVEDSAGNLHSVNHQAPIAMEHMGGSWVDGKYEPDPNRPWLRGQIEIREHPLQQSDAVALWGKLVFLATEDPVAIKVPFQFGMQWNSNDGVLKLRRWEAGRLVFDVEGNFPELMAVKALDDMGLVVSQPAELRTGLGKNSIELEVKQIPETIEFSIARTPKPTEFPLEIRVLQ